MEPNTGLDAYSPKEIAERVEAVCVAKANTPLLSLVMLGILAGAFIGLGSLFYVIVVNDSTLGFAASRILGGVVFSLGLLLVVAGAELFCRQQPACHGLGRTDASRRARCSITGSWCARPTSSAWPRSCSSPAMP